MRERLIGALLLGNNIANIGASALATAIFTAWFGEVGVLYATAVMTVMVVIFAEVLPKTIAINAPDRVSLLVARPMKRPSVTSGVPSAARSTTPIPAGPGLPLAAPSHETITLRPARSPGVTPRAPWRPPRAASPAP